MVTVGWHYFIESGVMFCVEMWVEPLFNSDSNHIETLRFLTKTVVLGGFGVGCVFCCFANCFFMDDDRDGPSLCYIHPPVPADVTTDAPYVPTPTYAHASTGGPKDPSPPDTGAFVVEEHVIMQGPTHVAVLQRTQVYGIERC